MSRKPAPKPVATPTPAPSLVDLIRHAVKAEIEADRAFHQEDEAGYRGNNYQEKKHADACWADVKRAIT